MGGGRGLEVPSNPEYCAFSHKVHLTSSFAVAQLYSLPCWIFCLRKNVYHLHTINIVDISKNSIGLTLTPLRLCKGRSSPLQLADGIAVPLRFTIGRRAGSNPHALSREVAGSNRNNNNPLVDAGSNSPLA